MRDRIPVVYILSNGRSGTTLLDMLLGSSPNAWTLGEAQLLPWELRENRSPCGCGRDLKACPFWNEVLPEVPLGRGPYPIDFFREQHGAGQVLRWSLLPDVIRGSLSGSRRRAAREYGRVNAEYFIAVLRAAHRETNQKVQWLIDASMDPYRLVWLQQSDFFRVRVIHLTKSPEGFVYSMIKHKESGRDWLALRMAGRWLVENILMMHICRAILTEDQWRHVRYEDLASNPKTVQRRLGRWLAIDFPEWEGKSFRAYTNHALSGNKMRWEDTEIRLDTRWKRHMSATNRLLSRVVTFPVAQALGHWRSTR